MASRRNRAPLPRLEPEGSDPKHLSISNAIRQQIATGELPAGAQLPTEAVLTRHFNVSRITVRRAIQDLTRDGILVGQQGRGTFVNASRAALEANVLFVHASDSDISYPYTALILEGLRTYGEVTSRGMRLQLTAMPEIVHQPPEDTTIEELVAFSRCHGIVTLPRIHPEAMARLVAEGIPIVMIGGQHFLEPPPGVTIVSNATGQTLDIGFRHLRDRGRRNIGLIRGELKGNLLSRDSITPVSSALGLDIPPGNIEIAAEWGINAGARAAARLLERAPQLDAIFAADDLFALGVLHTLWQRGVKVPGEIAVLGIGNLLGEHSHSGLSTIDVRLREQGELAGRCLQRHFKKLPVERLNLIQPILLHRSTT